MDLTEKTKNLNRHPWELSRSYNILKLLQANDNSFVYADIGAGDKYFTSKLLSITDGKVFAIDNEYKKSESVEDGIICLNDSSLLKNNSIDFIIIMDVLEHIKNDNAFLEEILEKLKPHGKLIITVPAMQFLFSSHDVFLKHYRRYSRKRLINLLQKQKIIIEQNYYFYSTLFLLRCISLLIEMLKSKKQESMGIGMWKYDKNNFITKFIYNMLNIDFFINKLISKMSIRLPGLSVLAICRNKKISSGSVKPTKFCKRYSINVLLLTCVFFSMSFP